MQSRLWTGALLLLSFPLLALSPPLEPKPVKPAPQATIVALTTAPTQVAPSGKASVQTLARGLNAFVARLEMAPGAKVPKHRDATEEYIHVLAGSGEITIDGKTSKLSAGDTVYMPAKAEVSFRNGPAKMVALQVFAGPAPAAKYQAWKAR